MKSEFTCTEDTVHIAHGFLSSVTGLLLAGVGHVTDPPDSQKNFLVCDSKTEKQAIEQAFNSFTRERKDIGIVLINQHVRGSGMIECGRSSDGWTACGTNTRHSRQVSRCIPSGAGDPE
jgi:hypothetical protein